MRLGRFLMVDLRSLYGAQILPSVLKDNKECLQLEWWVWIRYKQYIFFQRLHRTIKSFDSLKCNANPNVLKAVNHIQEAVLDDNEVRQLELNLLTLKIQTIQHQLPSAFKEDERPKSYRTVQGCELSRLHWKSLISQRKFTEIGLCTWESRYWWVVD